MRSLRVYIIPKITENMSQMYPRDLIHLLRCSARVEATLIDEVWTLWCGEVYVSCGAPSTIVNILFCYFWATLCEHLSSKVAQRVMCEEMCIRLRSRQNEKLSPRSCDDHDYRNGDSEVDDKENHLHHSTAAIMGDERRCGWLRWMMS